MFSFSLTKLAFFLLVLAFIPGAASFAPGIVSAQTGSQTAVQFQINKQRQRLSASDPEDRRDALMVLGSLHRAAASREALVGLSDSSPMVRAVATKAILSLGPEESVPALLPLLNDKDEFVRRETAYALGLTRSHKATDSLTTLLLNDKEDGVRAAAAVALGEIADESAAVPLSNILATEGGAGNGKKGKAEKNIFVLRAAARSLGQIKSRAAVPALVAALSNEKMVDDIRREAALALGLIGDPSAVPALRTASNSTDPYLAQTAYQALRKIAP
jgi:HEAT repeat protein